MAGVSEELTPGTCFHSFGEDGFLPMTDPWDERYIYRHEWLIFMVNVGKYTSPMDGMG